MQPFRDLHERYEQAVRAAADPAVIDPVRAVGLVGVLGLSPAAWASIALALVVAF